MADQILLRILAHHLHYTCCQDKDCKWHIEDRLESEDEKWKQKWHKIWMNKAIETVDYITKISDK